MLLLFFIVLLWITAATTTTRLLLAPDISTQRVISRFKRLLWHTLILYNFNIKIDLKGVLTRYKGILQAANHPGTKPKDSRRRLSIKNYINFMASPKMSDL